MITIGRLAISVGMSVVGANWNPFRPADTASAANIGNSERRHRPRTPVLILSANTTVSSIADGSRLKCSSGTSDAASAESMMKLRSSVV